ncbi:Bcr/CflA family efflux MFS transporter [Pseudofrancisella aestuarii]|uniref:Bcr/CflA family efflux transporter n=1 Tax=Pseudofrancisella aestuarii TaxID=2670347 RepID=A0ABV9TCJ5_9GAMM|nr:Bcr/CflA family efflux MFS transporter [Pseudofrancisella aestuarii]
MRKIVINNYSKVFLTYLAILATLAIITSDIYLPSMPTIKHNLVTTNSLVELTISLFMFGLAVGQLIYGPLSDNFGRYRILSAGLLIFILGSIGCYTSNTITFLLISRFIQAIGACAAMTLWQPMVIDSYGIKNAHNKLALIYPFMGVSPAISPVIGGYLHESYGWRSSFLVLVILGVLLCTITIIFLENKQPSKSSRSGFKKITKNYKRLLTSKKFLNFAALSFLGFGAYYAYLAYSPFLFKSMGYSSKEISMFYFPTTIAYFIGSFASKYSVGSIGKKRSLIIGIIIFFIGAFSLLIIGLFTKPIYAIEVIIPFSFIIVANGFLIPIGMSSAITLFEDISGTAAGAVGFFQSMTAFICSYIVAKISETKGLMAFSIVICIICIMVLFAFMSIFYKKFFRRRLSKYRMQ